MFILKKFEESFEKSPLIAQNLETEFGYYYEIFKNIEENFDYIPQVLKESKTINGGIIGVNVGLLGGSDFCFFKEYTDEVFKFVDSNSSKLDRINIGMFNTVFEQYLFKAIAEKREIDISFYLSDVNHAFDGLADFTGLPNKTNYIHTVGVYKRMKYIGDLLAMRLQSDYPEYYYRILNLIRTHQI